MPSTADQPPASLPLVLGITGASGAAYAVRLLEVLLQAGREVHLSISPSGQAVIAEAECYRITNSVAFTRAFAHHGDAAAPIAAAAGTFMLGTKGKVTRPQMIGADKLIAADGSKA